MNCKICTHDTFLIEDDKSYYFCKNCHYIFIDEKHIITPEEEKYRYEQHNNTIENEGYVKMFNNFIDNYILPFASTKKRALDFGCGPGPVLAELLSKKCFLVDIYDIYFAPIKTYKNNIYDLITATEVLEHILDPLRVLKELVGRLNENGLLAVMTLFHPEDTYLFKKWYKGNRKNIFRP